MERWGVFLIGSYKAMPDIPLLRLTLAFRPVFSNFLWHRRIYYGEKISQRAMAKTSAQTSLLNSLSPGDAFTLCWSECLGDSGPLKEVGRRKFTVPWNPAELLAKSSLRCWVVFWYILCLVEGQKILVKFRLSKVPKNTSGHMTVCFLPSVTYFCPKWYLYW